MWPNPQSADLVTFTEEILKGKLHFFCSVSLVNFNSDFKKLQVTVIRVSSDSFPLVQKQPPEVVYKDVLKNFAKFTEKHLWQSLFFNKVVSQTLKVWELSVMFLSET